MTASSTRLRSALPIAFSVGSWEAETMLPMSKIRRTAVAVPVAKDAEEEEKEVATLGEEIVVVLSPALDPKG